MNLFPDPSPSDLNRAVVANSRGTGTVLWTEGGHIAGDVEEIGASLWDLDLGKSVPEGISVWEGRYYPEVHNWEDPHIYEWHPRGTFRQPTAEEWAAICQNRNPWT